MGIFDRWRRGAGTASPPPQAPPTAGEQAVVPEGHQVFMYQTSPLPMVGNSHAVAWLAHLGSGSDEAEQELDEVLGKVDALMQGGRPRILLASAPGRLSSLMAPSDPQVTSHPHGMLLWTVDAAGLAGAPQGARLVQRWLRCLHALNRHAEPPVQCVYLHEAGSPRARTVSALVRGLGIEVRLPEAQKSTVLVEVSRPEHVVLSALTGTPLTAEPVDRSALEANQAKDVAERAGDLGRLQQLETEERAQLAARLAAGDEPEVAPVRRAPRLRRLLLAAADSDAARPALHQELLQREVPLQLMVDPRTGGVGLREWPGGIEAMAAYADAGSLLATARDLGLPPGAFAGAVMSPRELFAWAAEHSWTIAFNAYRAPGQPVYVMVPADDVKALARGELPAAARS